MYSATFTHAQMGGFQPKPTVGTGKLEGLIVDSLTKEPVAFASVVLREALEHKEVDGVLTDDKGNF